MSHILVCATPAPGHVNPMLTIASSLAERGHTVTFTTSDCFQSQVEAAALRFVPLQGKANIDYRAMDQHFPDRLLIPAGVDRLIYDFKHVFIDMIPDQHRTIETIESDSAVDLILTDTMFLGTFPQLLNLHRERPPVISCGITPLFFVTSRDRPPLGLPNPLLEQPIDYRPEHREFQAALRPANDHLAEILGQMQVPAPSNFFLDALATLPDRYLQLTGSSFELPCSDLPENVRFVGPVSQKRANDFEEPEWWSELDSGKPVVLVTQGTIANSDWSELIEPAIQALATDDVIVVAALGTNEPKSFSVPVPANVHVTPFVPFDKLMPKVDLFITNGGYGAVQQSLANGVPVLVAGATEDKPFVASRVAWSGCGIDLETAHPSPEVIRSAALAVFADPLFRVRARQMADHFAQYDALDTIAAEIEYEVQIYLESEAAESVLI